MPMSYGPSPVPYVHSLPIGLGLPPPPDNSGKTSSTSSEPPWWARLIEPFAQAGASRLAYGKTYPPYPGYGGGFSFQAPGGYYTGTGYGGFSPQTVMLMGGALVLALVLMRR